VQAQLTATISVENDTICQYSSAQMTFQGEGGIAPYKFTYKINNGVEQTVYSDNTGKLVLNINTDNSGNFIYEIISVESRDITTVFLTDISQEIVILNSPQIALGTNTLGIGKNEEGVFRYCGTAENVPITFIDGSSGNIEWYNITGMDGTVFLDGPSWPGSGLDHTFSQGYHEFSYTITHTGNTSGCETVTKTFGVYIGGQAVIGANNLSSGEICVNEEVVFIISDSVFTRNTPTGTSFTIRSNDGFYAYYANLGELPREIRHSYTETSCDYNLPPYCNNCFEMVFTATNPCTSANSIFNPIFVSSPPNNDLNVDTTLVCKGDTVCFSKLDTPDNGSVSSNTTCNREPKIIWKVQYEKDGSLYPSNYTAVSGSSPGSDYNNPDVGMWTTGSKEFCIIFNQPGEHIVTMRTGNRCGISERDTVIYVEDVLPAFSMVKTICVSEEVKLNNETDEGNLINSFITNYQWEIDHTAENCGTIPAYTLMNGDSLTSREPTIRFDSPGVYSIILSTDVCPKKSGAQKLSVMDKPKITINADDICEALIPPTYLNPTATIDSCGSPAYFFKWTFAEDAALSSHIDTDPLSTTDSFPSISYFRAGEKTILTEATNICGTTTETKTVIINETPYVNDIQDEVSCNGDTTKIAFSTLPTATITVIYEWTNSNPDIGLPASGVGDISFKAKNDETAPISATITVTPKSEAGCTGEPKEFTITVNPDPEITFSIAPQTICSKDQTQEVTLSSTTDGVTFEWTAIEPAGITGAVTSGTNTIPVQTLVNNTNAPITIDYVAKATTQSEETCPGSNFTYTITVSPRPEIADTTITACSEKQFTYKPVRFTVPSNIIYMWEGVSTKEISGTINNPENTPQTTTYNIRPGIESENGTGECWGELFTLTVIVDPIPVIQPETKTICNENGFEITPQNGEGNIVIDETFYIWGTPVSNPAGAITGGSAQSEPQSSVNNGKLTNTTTQDAQLTYTVYPVVSSTGCEGKPFEVTITVQSSPTGNISGGKDVCINASDKPEIIFTGINGEAPYTFTYTINNGTEQTIISGSDGIATVFAETDATGTFVYALTGISSSSSNQCVQPSESVTTVNVIDQPTISTQPMSVQQLCLGGQIDSLRIAYTGGAGVPLYRWYKSDTNSYSDGTLIPGATQAAYLPPASDYSAIGKYYYYVEISFSENSCVSVYSNIAEIEMVDVSPEINVTSQTNILCFGETTGAIEISVTQDRPANGYIYQWEGIGNNFSSAQQNIENIPAGRYKITVWGEICKTDTVFDITQPDKLVAGTIITPITCYGANDAIVDVTITGGTAPYEAIWQHDKMRSLSHDMLAPGTYEIAIYDYDNCRDTVSVTIVEANLFEMSPVIKQIGCHNHNDGRIELNLEGGTAPTTIKWDGVISPQTIKERVTAGTYTVEIEDGKGCILKDTFIIINPEPLTLSATIRDALDCNEPNSGSIVILPDGGTPDFQYAWINRAIWGNTVVTTQHLRNIPEGVYTINVTDAHGCPIDTVLTVWRPQPIIPTITPELYFDCNALIGIQTNTANVTGGMIPYQYEWYDKYDEKIAEGKNMEIAHSDVIRLKVTDSRGCYVEQTLSVEIPDYGIDVRPANCNERIYSFNVNAFNSYYADSYLWDFGDGETLLTYPRTINHTFDKPGSYNISLTINDRNCQNYTFTKTVFVEDFPVVSILPNPVHFCPGDTVVVEAFGANHYVWGNNDHTGETFQIFEEGKYFVKGTTPNGCYEYAEVIAEYTPAFNYNIYPNPKEATNQNPTIEFSTEDIPYSKYQWDFGDGYSDSGNPTISHTFEISANTKYTVTLTVRNPHGCYETTEIIIPVNLTLDKLPTKFVTNGENRFMKGWRMEVYNRNGVLLYKDNTGWNGTYKGKFVGNDTYFYFIWNEKGDGNLHKIQGYVTVTIVK